MKKLYSISLIATLLVSSSAVHANAAPRAGTNCGKKGLVAISAGKKFTCIASGKKLVWDGGILVNKPSSAISPSPIASVTPSATPSTASDSSKQESPQIPRVDALSIDDLNPQQVYGRSRQEIDDAINNSNYVNTFLNFNIGPNQIPTTVAAEKVSLAKAARLWANIYQPKEQLEVLFYNFADLEWAKAKFTQITGAESFHSADSCSKNYCGNASAGRTGNGPWIYEQGLGGTLWNKSTSAHEYTHLAQTSGNSDYWNLAPLWLVEGMAQFYGEAIGYSPFDTKLKTRGEMHRQYASDYKLANQGDMKTMLEKNNISTVRTLMQSVEFPNPRHQQALTSASYLLGSYCSEVLVAVYGQTAMEQFIKSFKNSSDWKANFYGSFGITVEDFYVKMTPYMFEMSKEL